VPQLNRACCYVLYTSVTPSGKLSILSRGHGLSETSDAHRMIEGMLSSTCKISKLKVKVLLIVYLLPRYSQRLYTTRFKPNPFLTTKITNSQTIIIRVWPIFPFLHALTPYMFPSKEKKREKETHALHRVPNRSGQVYFNCRKDPLAQVLPPPILLERRSILSGKKNWENKKKDPISHAVTIQMFSTITHTIWGWANVRSKKGNIILIEETLLLF
jgi:hypothetical protein